MCPAGQYSERSPYVVDKVDIPYPYKIREDKPTTSKPAPTTSKPTPTKTSTPKPKPTPTYTPKPAKPISGGNVGGSGGSSGGLGLLAGLAAITGAIALLSPVVIAMMGGKAPQFRI